MWNSIRRIHKAYNRTRDFNFSLSGLTGFDFHGKTVGVIGTGKIGRIFIDICRGFGMKVIAYDRFPAKDSGIDYVSLDELFERSDIISLHTPNGRISMFPFHSYSRSSRGVRPVQNPIRCFFSNSGFGNRRLSLTHATIASDGSSM